MALRGSHLALRDITPWVGAALLALLVAPAYAFFPPVPVYVPPHRPPIHVPHPPVVTPPQVTPPGGGGGTSGGGGGTSGGNGGPPPPDTNPEPASLVLALLGGAGVSVFVACRRRRSCQKGDGG